MNITGISVCNCSLQFDLRVLWLWLKGLYNPDVYVGDMLLKYLCIRIVQIFLWSVANLFHEIFDTKHDLYY